MGGSDTFIIMLVPVAVSGAERAAEALNAAGFSSQGQCALIRDNVHVVLDTLLAHGRDACN